MKHLGTILSSCTLCGAIVVGVSGCSSKGYEVEEKAAPSLPAATPKEPVEVEEEVKKPEVVKPEVASYKFDDEKIGEVPSKVEILETASLGTVATWAIQKVEDAPSQPNAFGVMETKNKGGTYNLAMVKDSKYKNVGVSVAVKAVSGKEGKGGGPVWRAKDGDNYYAASWNAIEGNFQIYIVKDGKRKQLASSDIKLDPKKWHTIRILMTGESIKCWIDGDMVLVTNDSTFEKGGMIGMWTEADAATLFDNLAARSYELR